MKKSRLLAMALLLPSLVMAQWSDTYNNTVVTIPDSWTIFAENEIVVDVEQGTSFYTFLQPASNGMVTRLQIVDEDGCNTFDDEGLLISDKSRPLSLVNNKITLLDSDGNLIIVVCDSRNQVDDTADAMSYSIYKLTQKGEMLWGDDGIDLDKGFSSELKALMNVIELEDGSYVFAWQESAGYATDGTDLYGIAMMRLSKDGDFLWDANVTVNSSTSDYKFPYLVNVGSNQFILVYTQGTALNIMAQKYDFDGTIAWAEPVKVYGGGFPSDELIHLVVKVKPMPNGGVLIGWYDDRYYTDRASMFLAYLGSDGTHQFSEGSNGLQVAYSDALTATSQDFIYSEDAECIYVTWQEINYSSQDYERLAVQKIALNGELQWDIEGKDVVAYGDQDFGNLQIQDAGAGDVAVFFTETVSYYDVQPRAIKFNTNGATVWTDPVFTISTYASTKENFHVSKLIDDSYWIAAWQDMRDDATQKSIYAQKIDVNNPELGIAETTTDASTFVATTTGDIAKFALQIERQSYIELSLYSVAGEQVATLYSGELEAGTQTISYPTSGLTAGVYIANLRSNTTSSSVKLVIE